MHRRYKELREARQVMLTEKDADLVFSVDFSTPPPVTWEWLQDPNRRNIWNGDVHWYSGERPKGRTGSGASNHCAHGKSVSTEVTVDWRPFEYSTIDSYENGKRMFSETFRLEPLPNGGTHVTNFSQIHLPLPRPVRRIVARMIFLNKFKYDQLVRNAAELAGEEYKRSSSVDPFLNPE
jgi:hypothetical protein